MRASLAVKRQSMLAAAQALDGPAVLGLAQQALGDAWEVAGDVARAAAYVVAIPS